VRRLVVLKTKRSGSICFCRFVSDKHGARVLLQGGKVSVTVPGAEEVDQLNCDSINGGHLKGS
jgi:hypothetical protein